MSDIDQEAISGLTSAVSGLLPDAPEPGVQFTLVTHPIRLAPIGLGGYIGMHDDPEGEIVGRRVEADALVGVQGAEADDLNSTIALIINALLTTDRAVLRQNGILRLQFARVEPNPAAETARDIVFSILHEYLHLPGEAGDIILEIPLNLSLDTEALP
ncbi:MAG: hypothetical protein ACRDIB_06375 [Ardenticatenaceae bacterium]